MWGLYSGLTKRALHGKRLFSSGWGVELVGAPRIFWRFALARQSPTPSTPCKCTMPLPCPTARAPCDPLDMCPHALYWHISVLQDTPRVLFVSPSFPAWINFLPFKTPEIRLNVNYLCIQCTKLKKSCSPVWNYTTDILILYMPYE